MNVTLSVDEEVLARVRELAARQGTSLNQIIREHLAELAGKRTPEEIVHEVEQLWAQDQGDSGGRRWTRDELHERTGLR
jgi:hypothetical protein